MVFILLACEIRVFRRIKDFLSEKNVSQYGVYDGYKAFLESFQVWNSKKFKINICSWPPQRSRGLKNNSRIIL